MERDCCSRRYCRFHHHHRSRCRPVRTRTMAPVSAATATVAGPTPTPIGTDLSTTTTTLLPQSSANPRSMITTTANTINNNNSSSVATTPVSRVAAASSSSSTAIISGGTTRPLSTGRLTPSTTAGQTPRETVIVLNGTNPRIATPATTTTTITNTTTNNNNCKHHCNNTTSDTTDNNTTRHIAPVATTTSVRLGTTTNNSISTERIWDPADSAVRLSKLATSKLEGNRYIYPPTNNNNNNSSTTTTTTTRGSGTVGNNISSTTTRTTTTTNGLSLSSKPCVLPSPTFPARSLSAISSSRCCRRTVAAPVTWQPQHLILLVVSLLTVLTDAAGECKVRTCQKHWSSYQMNSRSIDTDSDKYKCIALRTTWRCIHQVKHGCSSSLEYHSEKSRVKNQMEIRKCSEDGDIYSTTNTTQRPPADPPDPECTYKGNGVYKHCGLFGDPHLRTFNRECQTCKIEGAWSLVNNKHLIVMVTNRRVGVDSSATATSMLTVRIKRNDRCGANDFVTYGTQDRNLPSTFVDGAMHYGPGKGIELKVLEPYKYVRIHIKYIDTTILIRQIGRYFTFSIRMPEEIVKASSSDEQPELCVNGCPKFERIDYQEFLARKQQKLKEYEIENKVAMSRVEAEMSCRNANVVDFYFDSCVFDLMTTGDRNFTVAAYSAWQDLLKLNPISSKDSVNRTDLKIYDNKFSSTSPIRTTMLTRHLVIVCIILSLCQSKL